MTQGTLFLLVVSLTGIFTLRWTLRLAPLSNELPLKALLATLLAGLLVASTFSSYQASRALLTVTLIISPIFVFAPLLVVWLARVERFELAKLICSLLYWTEGGRLAIGHLLAQVALQQGNGLAIKSFIPEEKMSLLLQAQSHALEENWQSILNLEVPSEGDNRFLALAARIEALVALGRLSEAEYEFMLLQEKFEQSQGPIAYRSLVLSEARIAAEKGQYQQVTDILAQPPPHIQPHTVFAIAARAAEQSQFHGQAADLYKRAYALAPTGLRERYARKLKDFGQPLPTIEKQHRQRGTWGLFIALVIAFFLQLGLDRAFGPNTANVAAGFWLNFPQVPQQDALWRYLSYGFVHGGIVHIAFNLWVLVDIGRRYEARRGWENLLAAFVLGTILGAILTVIFQANAQLVLVGASGGILGIAGALLADTFRGKTEQDRLLTRSLMQWMVFIVLFSLAIPNVSLWGHVGGVIGGFIWGFFRHNLAENRRVDRAMGLASIGLMLYVIIEATFVLIRFI